MQDKSKLYKSFLWLYYQSNTIKIYFYLSSIIFFSIYDVYLSAEKPLHIVNQNQVMQNFTPTKSLKENYDEYYKEGELEWRKLGATDKVNNIIQLCKNIPHCTVLEVGAGDGAILQELSHRQFGEQLYGLELSASGVTVIQKRQISNLVECQQFDGYKIPYNSQQFDLVILTHVLEHVEFPRQLLYEIARVAQHVCIEVPLEDNIRLSKNFVPDKVGHINYYNSKTIRRLVQTCQFEVLEQHVSNISKKMYKYASSRKGIAQYYIKEISLNLFSEWATFLWTYHSTLICRSPYFTETKNFNKTSQDNSLEG